MTKEQLLEAIKKLLETYEQEHDEAMGCYLQFFDDCAKTVTMQWNGEYFAPMIPGCELCLEEV